MFIPCFALICELEVYFKIPNNIFFLISLGSIMIVVNS